MDRLTIRKTLNICIMVLVAVGWVYMTFFSKDAALAVHGVAALRFFTVQSNLLVGIASVVWLICIGKDEATKRKAEVFKYIATASVMLTFITVMAFLGPLYGYASMLQGANLAFHLFVPVLAACEMLLLCDCEFTTRDNLLAVIPPFLYGLGYLANILINGMGEWPDTNDWYLFFHWGYPVGFVIYAVILLVTWLSAFAIRKLKRKH